LGFGVLGSGVLKFRGFRIGLWVKGIVDSGFRVKTVGFRV
jgi:hypothetical protein